MARFGSVSVLPSDHIRPLFGSDTHVEPSTLVQTAPLLPGVVERAACTLHFWLAGPLDAPLVVLTHGLGVDHHEFDSLIPVLASSHRLLLWDLRGHGMSTGGASFGMEEALGDLLALLDHIECERATFVGTSLGGALSQMLAYRHPERVDGLALISCGPITRRPAPGRRLQTWLTGAFLRFLPHRPLRAQFSHAYTVRREVHAYVSAAMERAGRRTHARAWHALADFLFDDPAYRLPVPTLVAYGAYDGFGLMHGDVASAWSEAGLDRQPVEIPGAGHSALQDNPAFCSKMLRDFLFRRVHPA